MHIYSKWVLYMPQIDNVSLTVNFFLFELNTSYSNLDVVNQKCEHMKKQTMIFFKYLSK